MEAAKSDTKRKRPRLGWGQGLAARTTPKISTTPKLSSEDSTTSQSWQAASEPEVKNAQQAPAVPLPAQSPTTRAVVKTTAGLPPSASTRWQWPHQTEVVSGETPRFSGAAKTIPASVVGSLISCREVGASAAPATLSKHGDFLMPPNPSSVFSAPANNERASKEYVCTPRSREQEAELRRMLPGTDSSRIPNSGEILEAMDQIDQELSRTKEALEFTRMFTRKQRLRVLDLESRQVALLSGVVRTDVSAHPLVTTNSGAAISASPREDCRGGVGKTAASVFPRTAPTGRWGTNQTMVNRVLEQNRKKSMLAAHVLKAFSFIQPLSEREFGSSMKQDGGRSESKLLDLNSSRFDDKPSVLRRGMAASHMEQLVPLYSRPSEAPCWERNRVTHTQRKHFIMQRVRTEKDRLRGHMLRLVAGYKSGQSIWEKKVASWEASRDTADSELVDMAYERLVADTQVGDGSRRYPSRGGGGGQGGGSDFVGSEWEQEARLKEIMLLEQREKDRIRNAAKLPDMILTDRCRHSVALGDNHNARLTSDGAPARCQRLKLYEPCGRRPRPNRGEPCGIPSVVGCNCAIAVLETNKLVNPWTDLEKCIFIDKFMQYPKDFRKIATFLRNKSTNDCVRYYYNTKKEVDYKQLLREQHTRRKSQRRPSWRMTAQAAEQAGVSISCFVSNHRNVLVNLEAPILAELRSCRAQILIPPEVFEVAVRTSLARAKSPVPTAAAISLPNKQCPSEDASVDRSDGQREEQAPQLAPFMGDNDFRSHTAQGNKRESSGAMEVDS